MRSDPIRSDPIRSDLTQPPPKCVLVGGRFFNKPFVLLHVLNYCMIHVILYQLRLYYFGNVGLQPLVWARMGRPGLGPSFEIFLIQICQARSLYNICMCMHAHADHDFDNAAIFHCNPLRPSIHKPCAEQATNRAHIRRTRSGKQATEKCIRTSACPKRGKAKSVNSSQTHHKRYGCDQLQ